jgi:hypothetical protein
MSWGAGVLFGCCNYLNFKQKLLSFGETARLPGYDQLTMGCSVITGLGCKAEPRPGLPGSPARIVPETEPMQKRWVSEYSSSAPACPCCYALEIDRYGFQLRAKGTQVGPPGVEGLLQQLRLYWPDVGYHPVCLFQVHRCPRRTANQNFQIDSRRNLVTLELSKRHYNLLRA